MPAKTETARPKLTDVSALRMHRARAAGMPAPAWFLHEHAIDIIQERLQEVNRTFRETALVCGADTVAKAAFENATHVSDDDILDLPESAFELVLHIMGLHWANDPVGQIVQARRALRPDGLFIAVTFGGQTLNELRGALAEAETRVTGGLSPRVAPMGEVRDYGSLLQRAGFALPVSDSVSLSVEYETPLHLMQDLRAMGETNALDGRLRKFTRRSVIDGTCQAYSAAHTTRSGRVRATFELVFLTGWAPAASQQQPLKPGAASTRLADVLGVAEQSTGEKAGPD